MRLAATLGLGLVVPGVVLAQVSGIEKDFGRPRAIYAGAHIGYGDTNANTGGGTAYGAEGGYLWRFDGNFGSAYAGAGPFYLGSSAAAGTMSTVGGQAMVKYREGMFAVLFGGTWLGKIPGATANPYLGWGARLTFDFPVYNDRVTAGPGGTFLFLTTGDFSYYNFGAFLTVKAWW